MNMNTSRVVRMFTKEVIKKGICAKIPHERSNQERPMFMNTCVTHCVTHFVTAYVHEHFDETRHALSRFKSGAPQRQVEMGELFAPARPVWSIDSHTDGFFDEIIKNLAPGDGKNVATKLKAEATVGMGRGRLGGGAGFFDLQRYQAHAVVKDAGGGPGWVKMMELEAKLAFVPNVVPQASDIGQLVLHSETGVSLPSSSEQSLRPKSISDKLVKEGSLHLQVVPSFCTADCEFTKTPRTSKVRESEVSHACKLICVSIAQKHIALNAGVGLCNVLGRSWREAMPLIPDKGKGDSLTRGECRDRGKMIFNTCQNLLYVCQPHCLLHASLLVACIPVASTSMLLANPTACCTAPCSW